MSDTTIFIIGFLVFGLALASTMILVIPPSRQDIRQRKSLDRTGRDPRYVPETAENR